MEPQEKDSDPGTDQRAADLVQRIKLGTLDPGLLTKDQRLQCVEALSFEAVSPTGMAQFLKVTDRTIRRDVAELRMRNALSPSPDLAREIIGEYVLLSRIHKGNLMKLARNSSASTAERSQAEYYAHVVGSDMITKLQSLGYLPKSADALLVLQKTEENKNSENLSTLCTELDDMLKVNPSPEEAAKLLELRAAVTGEKNDGQ